MNIFEFKIAADYLPYITKGDTSLFDWAGGEELKREVDNWINKNKRKHGKGRYIPIKGENGLEHEFIECDITGEYSFCVDLGYLVI